jgi:hypothetical protein
MKGPDLKDHPLLVAAKNSVNTEDVLELLELQEIEHVASYVLTESGKLCVQEKKAHWLFQSAMFSKASTSRIQSFGGCNYSNSLIRMINSLRLELMDEAAILLNDDTLIRASPLFIRCSSQPTLLQIFLVKDSCVGSLWSAEQARKVLGSDTVPPDAAMKDSVAELVKEAGRCIISMDLEEAKSHPGWRSCDLQSFRLLETFIDELRSGEMKSEMILLPAEQGVKIEKLLRIQALFNASSSLKEISVAKWFPMLWDDASWWFEKGKIKKLIELKKN